MLASLPGVIVLASLPDPCRLVWEPKPNVPASLLGLSLLASLLGFTVLASLPGSILLAGPSSEFISLCLFPEPQTFVKLPSELEFVTDLLALLTVVEKTLISSGYLFEVAHQLWHQCHGDIFDSLRAICNGFYEVCVVMVRWRGSPRRVRISQRHLDESCLKD